MYLANFACVISDTEKLLPAMFKLINDNDYRDKIKRACQKRYELDFSRDKQIECLEHILLTDNR